MGSIRMREAMMAFLLPCLVLGVRAIEVAKLRQCMDSFKDSTNLNLVCESSDSATSLEHLVRDYMATCLEEDLRAIRLTVPNTSLVPVLERHAATFRNLYNVSVQFNVLGVDKIAAEVRGEAWQQLQGFSDGWIVDPSVTGDLAAANALANLTAYVFTDQDLDWSDVANFFRTISAYFNKRIIGVPLDGDLLLTYYRRDLFTRYNLSVPMTWDDFTDLAESMNGTDTDGDGVGDLWGVCFDNSPLTCKSSWILTAILAPYVQYLGTQQGAYIDPASMRPLINNAAMARAVQLYRRLFAVQPRPTGCAATNPFFDKGNCLMTVNFGDQFKVSARQTLQNNISYGNPSFGGWQLGVSRLPGSPEVLNRTTGNLVKCTGTATCPYAELVQLADRSSAWVNFAPFSAFGGWTGMVNARTSTEYQLLAFKFFSHMSMPENNIVDVLDPTSGIDPYRTSQLTLSPSNLALWADSGYDTNATSSYLKATADALNSGNVVLDVRLQTMATVTRYVVGSVADNVTWLQQPVPETLAAGQFIMEYVLNNSGSSMRDLQLQYWQLIGSSGDGGPPKGPKSATSSGDEDMDGEAAALSTRTTVLLAVLIPAGAVLLATAVGVLVWRRVLSHRDPLYGNVKAPTAGPQTSLLITDIQDSTCLWEALPDRVMDEALEIHHAVVRQVLTKHNGYESATEGDSFILAFHTAEEAVACAMRIQMELLAAPWPPQLLNCGECASAGEVWVAPACSAQQHSALQEMLGGSSCELEGAHGRPFCVVRCCWGTVAAAAAAAAAIWPRPRRIPMRRTSGNTQHQIFASVTAAASDAGGGAAAAGKPAALQGAVSMAAAAAAAAASGDTEMGLKRHDSHDGQLQLTTSQLGRSSSASGLGEDDGTPTVYQNWSASIEGGFLSRGSSQLRDDVTGGGGGGFLGRLSNAISTWAPRTRRQHPQLHHHHHHHHQLSTPSSVTQERRHGKLWFGGGAASGAAGSLGAAAIAAAAAAGAGGAGCGASGPGFDSGRLLIDHIRSVWLAYDPQEAASCTPVAAAACITANQTRYGAVHYGADSSAGAVAAAAAIDDCRKDPDHFEKVAAATSWAAGGGEVAPKIKVTAAAPAVAAAAAALAPALPAAAQLLLPESNAVASVPATAAAAAAGGGVLPYSGGDLVPSKLIAPNVSLPSYSSNISFGDTQGSQLLLQPSPLLELQLQPPPTTPSTKPPPPPPPQPISLCDDVIGVGPVCRQPAVRHYLVFRGLRVRMGIHSGVPDAGDVMYNQAEARYHYAGGGMAIARAVQGAAAGGQVLLSDSTFARVRDAQQSKRLRETVLIHAGEHVVGSKLPGTQQLYQALPRQLLCRLPLHPPLKVIRTISAGALEAPVGRVAVAFVSVVGAAALQAWDPEITRRALEVFLQVFLATAATTATRGMYLVECTGGLLLATFASAADALSTCAALQVGLLVADWPQELLEHDLCEEVTIATPQVEGTIVRGVLFRGLRVKVGIDYGPARAALNRATGRIAYRGRVMNRAARINAKGASGQVLCSSAAWQAASDSAEGGPAALGLAALSLGWAALKGISEPVELLEIRTLPTAPPPKGASTTKPGRIVQQTTPPSVAVSPPPDAVAAAATAIAVTSTAAVSVGARKLLPTPPHDGADGLDRPLMMATRGDVVTSCTTGSGTAAATAAAAAAQAAPIHNNSSDADAASNGDVVVNVIGPSQASVLMGGIRHDALGLLCDGITVDANRGAAAAASVAAAAAAATASDTTALPTAADGVQPRVVCSGRSFSNLVPLGTEGQWGPGAPSMPRRTSQRLSAAAADSLMATSVSNIRGAPAAAPAAAAAAAALMQSPAVQIFRVDASTGIAALELPL